MPHMSESLRVILQLLDRRNQSSCVTHESCRHRRASPHRPEFGIAGIPSTLHRHFACQAEFSAAAGPGSKHRGSIHLFACGLTLADAGTANAPTNLALV